jgi:hypothetical protein
MDLMKKQKQGGEISEDISIRCVSYGAPPVYECAEGTTHPNIFAVFNNHDGIGLCKKLMILLINPFCQQGLF